MRTAKKLNSGIVWLESPRGKFYPVSFEISGDGVPEKELEEFVRKQCPSCKSVIFTEKKPEFEVEK